MNPKAEESKLTGQLVTGNFTIQATMPNGKTINVSGYLYENESIESANDRVSMFQGIVDHQRTIAEIPELEAKYDQAKRRIADLRAHFGLLAEKKEKGGKLSSQEKQALETMDINLKQYTDNLADGAKAIAEAKAKVGIQ